MPRFLILTFACSAALLVACGSSDETTTGGAPSPEAPPSVPLQWRVSEDGHRLERGGFHRAELFDDSVVETFHIDFPMEDWQAVLAANKDAEIDVGATVRYRDQVLEEVGVRYRGMTSYLFSGEKKSFSLDFAWKRSDQSLDGYEELKLNSGYGDPSGIRQVLYSHLARENVPMAQAAFAQVIVNGRNFGLYAKVQKHDRRHAREWLLDADATRFRAERPGGFDPATFDPSLGLAGIFGEGRSTLNDLGPDGESYQEAYSLKGEPRVADPWQDLANAAHALGNVAPGALGAEVAPYLDLDESLWFLATENLFADDDGYVAKGGMDYYLYFDVATGRIMPIEYDGNETFAAGLVETWGPFHKADNPSYPLLHVLLADAELRQRYLAHYRTVLERTLDPSRAIAALDAYVPLVEPYVADETAVREYPVEQFHESVAQLRAFFETRRAYVLADTELAARGLVISEVSLAVGGKALARPTSRDRVQVSARVSSPVRGVSLYHGAGLAGPFDRIPMALEGDRFVADVPPYPAGEHVRYYVEAIADDAAGTATYEPAGAEHDVYLYRVGG